jgi:DnaJ-domain-containing protein 1
MEGRCLKGSFAGRALSTLSEDDLLQLLAELRATDTESAILLEAYLDHFWPHWRDGEANEADKAADRRARGGNRMSREEALDMLGLEPGASEEEIRAAHRKLMKKVHPDQGGSDYLAARINEAKEVLLGKK